MRRPVRPQDVLSPEHVIQRTIFKHFEQRPAPGVVAWHCPTGGYRRPTEAKILSGMGVIKGVSDICAVAPCQCPECGYGPLGIFHALELKTEIGRTSEAQLEFINKINATGGYATVAQGLDAALRCLEAWKLLVGKAS